MPPYKRRHFFINKEFQGKYIFKAFLSVAVGSAIFALMFSFFSSNTLSIVYENYHLKLGTTPLMLLNKILEAQWLFILLAGIAVAVTMLFMTHRIAGPFFRFEKTLDKMTAKDLTERIYLRKNDEGKCLGEKINGFTDMLGNDLHRIRQSATLIRQCCETVQSVDCGKRRQDEIDQKWREIRHQNQIILDIINEFNLGVK